MENAIIKDRAYWLGELKKARADKEGLKERYAKLHGFNINNIEEEGFVELQVNGFLFSYEKYIDENFPDNR